LKNSASQSLFTILGIIGCIFKKTDRTLFSGEIFNPRTQKLKRNESLKSDQIIIFGEKKKRKVLVKFEISPTKKIQENFSKNLF